MAFEKSIDIYGKASQEANEGERLARQIETATVVVQCWKKMALFTDQLVTKNLGDITPLSSLN